MFKHRDHHGAHIPSSKLIGMSYSHICVSFCFAFYYIAFYFAMSNYVILYVRPVVITIKMIIFYVLSSLSMVRTFLVHHTLHSPT